MKTRWTLGLVAVAVTAALVAFALPAYHASQDRKWRAAGQRALAQLSTPESYRPYRATAHEQLCRDDSSQRCFVAPGDPTSNLISVRAALAPLIVGKVRQSCHPDGFANIPQACQLVVPVRGSRLLVMLFAHVADRSKPEAAWTFDGTVVEVVVDSR